MESTTKHLLEIKELQHLKKQNMNEIIVEFIFFTLHQFSRLFFDCLGEKKRNIIMDGIIVVLHSFFVKLSSDNLKNNYNSLTIDTLQDYLDDPSFKELLDDFVNVYNEKETEYSNYFVEPEKGKGLSGTLLWEFGKKIAKLANRENDLSIIMKVQMLGVGYTHFADAIKKVLED